MNVTIGRIRAAFFVALALPPAVSRAVDCDVPRPAHPTVQSAIDDAACTTINLGDQSYSESLLIRRSLSIVGPPELADIAGYVEVGGSGTVVEMTNLMVENGCVPYSFLVTDGGQVNTTRLEVVSTDGAPCPPVDSVIFADGFESGSTSRWSVAVP